MLVLSSLHTILSTILTQDGLQTVILFTPFGQLVSTASQPSRSKEDIKVLIGLAGEVWRETKAESSFGMVDSEMGRLMVVPVEAEHAQTEPASPSTSAAASSSSPEVESNHNGVIQYALDQPLFLLALSGNELVDWEEARQRAIILAKHLSKTFSKYRPFMGTPRVYSNYPTSLPFY